MVSQQLIRVKTWPLLLVLSENLWMDQAVACRL